MDKPARLDPASPPDPPERDDDLTDGIRDALLDYRNAQEHIEAEGDPKILSAEAARRWHKTHKDLAPGHRQKRGRRGSG